MPDLIVANGKETIPAPNIAVDNPNILPIIIIFIKIPFIDPF